MKKNFAAGIFCLFMALAATGCSGRADDMNANTSNETTDLADRQDTVRDNDGLVQNTGEDIVDGVRDAADTVTDTVDDMDTQDRTSDRNRSTGNTTENMRNNDDGVVERAGEAVVDGAEDVIDGTRRNVKDAADQAEHTDKNTR